VEQATAAACLMFHRWKEIRAIENWEQDVVDVDIFWGHMVSLFGILRRP
jgi:hypothetical protein